MQRDLVGTEFGDVEVCSIKDAGSANNACFYLAAVHALHAKGLYPGLTAEELRRGLSYFCESNRKTELQKFLDMNSKITVEDIMADQISFDEAINQLRSPGIFNPSGAHLILAATMKIAVVVVARKVLREGFTAEAAISQGYDHVIYLLHDINHWQVLNVHNPWLDSVAPATVTKHVVRPAATKQMATPLATATSLAATKQTVTSLATATSLAAMKQTVTPAMKSSAGTKVVSSSETCLAYTSLAEYGADPGWQICVRIAFAFKDATPAKIRDVFSSQLDPDMYQVFMNTGYVPEEFLSTLANILGAVLKCRGQVIRPGKEVGGRAPVVIELY